MKAVSFKDEAALAMAMQGLDVIINAVGNSNDGETYAPLVHRTIRAADAVLVTQEGYGFLAVWRPLILQVPTIWPLNGPGSPECSGFRVEAREEDFQCVGREAE